MSRSRGRRFGTWSCGRAFHLARFARQEGECCAVPASSRSDARLSSRKRSKMTSDLFPLSAPAKVHHNTLESVLAEEAIRRGEARFSDAGALVVETGVHTGRSVQDKFTV